MSIDRVVMALAGLPVLMSELLSRIYSPCWLLLTALLGASPVPAAVTGFRPTARVLKRLGPPPAPAFP